MLLALQGCRLILGCILCLGIGGQYAYKHSDLLLPRKSLIGQWVQKIKQKQNKHSKE